jgi:ABC-2 type transport system permease protein
VNAPHFRAFVWLRWRLFANQLTRGGIFSQILLGILAVGAVLSSIALLIGSFLAGLLLLPETSPIVVLLVWDGLVLSFLFNWCLGLVTELQRSEALSLDRFLHLPVSLSGVFTLNYMSSLVCMTMLLFVPAMLGMSLGLTLAKGPLLAVQLPAALAFLFMVTALSYQFQGWLASLMVNKRRRRTIIVVVSLVFVLIFQTPNLVNLFRPWNTFEAEHKEETVEIAKLSRALEAKEITQEEYQKRRTDMQRERDERATEASQSWRNTAWIVNMALPIGWLPWGAAAAMDGNPLPGLLATLAYTLIGTASLWRAYRTTLRMYTGQFTAGTASTTPAPKAPFASSGVSPIPAGAATFLEKAIPWLSEQAAVVALSGFRSLSRAPEVKMLLLSPIFIVVVLGGMFMHGADWPETFRPVTAFAVIATILFTFGQVAGNQFGYDRSGFRIFVLSPAPRREILLGKNLSLAPLVFGLATPVVALATIVMPMRFDQLLTIPFQFVSMFLIYCMAANLLSILAPMPVAAGSLKPITPKMVPMLLHLAFFFAMPLALIPALAPWGIEASLEALDLSLGMPIALLLTMLECAVLVGLFRIVLTWEGKLLQAREQKILETVVAKAE